MRALRTTREILSLIFVSVVYFAIGSLGTSLANAEGHASPIWPASGFALAFVAMYGRRYMASIFLGNLALGALTHSPLLPTFMIAIGNTLECFVGSALLLRLLKSSRVSFPKELLSYFVVSFVASGLSALIGGTSLYLDEGLSFVQIFNLISIWWIGNSLGIVTLTPLLILLAEQQGFHVRFEMKMLERIGIYGAVLAVSYLGFGSDSFSQLIFLLYLLLLVAVIRLGTADVKFLTLIITALSIYSTIHQVGPFVIGSPRENLLCLQIFLASVGLTALSLSDFKNMGSMRYVAVSLVATWALTASVSYFVEKSAREQDQNRLTKLSQQVVADIKDRFRIYEDALRGGVGLFRASKTIDRKEWAAYINAAQFMNRYPGIHGVSVIWPLKSDQIKTFERRQARDQAPGFKVWAPIDWENPVASGARSERFVVGLTEPQVGTQMDLGLDVGADPSRRQIAELARDSGKPTLSTRIKLMREKRPAFLMFLPFYHSAEPPATELARRREFMMWIGATFISEDFFGELLSDYTKELRITVFDGAIDGNKAFLYSTDPRRFTLELVSSRPPRFEKQIGFVQAQQQFSLGFERNAGFVSAYDSTGAWITGMGALVSLLMGGLVSVLGAMNRKAEELAFQKTALLIKSESRVRELNRDLEERVFERTRELKNLNQRLLESETQFRELADSMPQIVWTARPDGYLDYFNRGWFDFTGFARGDLGDKTWLTIMPEEDGRLFTTTWFNAITRDCVFEQELRLWDRHSNQYVWHLARAVSIKDGSGTVIKWIGTSTNIHEHKSNLEALKLSESRLAAMVDQSPIATQMIKRDGRVNRVNRAWLDLWSISLEEFQGQEFRDYNVLHDERLRAMGVTSYIERAMAGEPVVAPMIQYNSYLPGCPERRRWMEIYFSPVREESGEIFEICLTYKDVSSQVEAMEQIRMKQAELEAIMDNSTAVIYLKDSESRLLMVNKQYRKLLADPHLPLIGKFDHEIWPADFAADFRANDMKVMTSRMAIQEEELVPEADGIHTYLSSKFPIFDARGEVRAVCGISTDITEQKKAKEERALLEIRERSALEASLLKSEFLANMSHEIRTPINGIIGMTRLLLETPLTHEQQSFTSSITKSSGLLLTLVNDILDLSKVEAGKLELEVLPFSVEELVRDTKDCFEPLIIARGLNFRARMDVDRDRHYLGDPSRIRQVLNNLISNAMKFTSKGSIGLDVSFVGRSDSLVELKFSVWDTGIGISAEDTKRLFEKFSQGDSSTARKYGGTGLGLAICQRLVELMNGRIEVESREGEGAAFHFTIKIPAADAESMVRYNESEQASKSGALIASERRELRVLVAEDNSVNQEITLRMLTRAGYRAEAVASGIEVLEAMKGMKYDLILMDCQMPEMDGYEAARELRERGFTLPIIALTANAFKEDRERCLEAGMTDYLSKPVSGEKLIRCLDRYLSHEREQLLDVARAHRAMLQRSEILDREILERLKQLDADGERGFLKKLIQMYVDATPKSLQDLRREVQNSSPSIPRIAHSLKASSANLGVRNMVVLLQKIEDGEYDTKDLPEMVDLLEMEFQRASEELLHV